MTKPDFPNREFELGGINHVALVCADMQRTVDFYSGVLGMPLSKSLDHWPSMCRQRGSTSTASG